jgi:predicted nucleic acid-binding protein
VSFLVDSDICSAHLKGQRRVNARFEQYTGRLHISAVTASELFTWARRAGAPNTRLAALQNMLQGISFHPVDYDVAQRSGELRAALLDRGLPMATTDLLIAATAQIHELTLVTHNVRHFQNVPDLTVEDWLAT